SFRTDTFRVAVVRGQHRIELFREHQRENRNGDAPRYDHERHRQVPSNTFAMTTAPVRPVREPTPDEVVRAMDLVASHLPPTPVITSPLLGDRVLLKLET